MKERGGGSVLAVAATAVVIMTVLAVVAATQLVTARAQAVLAADAAALAAAVNTFPPAADQTSPRQAASLVAAANGATLTRCSCPVDPSMRARSIEVRVVVMVEAVLLGSTRIGAGSRAEYIP